MGGFDLPMPVWYTLAIVSLRSVNLRLQHCCRTFADEFMKNHLRG